MQEIDRITSASSMVIIIWLSTATSRSEPIRALAQTEHRSATAVDCVTAPSLSCEGSNCIRPDNRARCVRHIGYDSVNEDFTRCQHSDSSSEINKNSTIITSELNPAHHTCLQLDHAYYLGKSTVISTVWLHYIKSCSASYNTHTRYYTHHHGLELRCLLKRRQ